MTRDGLPDPPRPPAVASSASRRVWGAYATAIVAPFVLLILKLNVASLGEHPFLLSLTSVVLSAWIGGLGPGLVAGALAALVATYYFIPPFGSFQVADPLPLALFALEAIAITVMLETMHAGRRALAASEERLRAAHRGLERTSRAELATEQQSRARTEVALTKSEEQLRQAQKMEAIGNLAGGVAHDFNNLLSVILSYSQMLAEDLAPGDPMRADLDEIRGAGMRAVALTRQLLAFSRKQVLQPQIVDLNDTLRGMEKLLKRLIREDVELIVLAGGGGALGKVAVDPGQLEQVIMNLAVNARDAMPDGGKLTIETTAVHLDETSAQEHSGTKPGPHVMLAMRDTGTGIDEATLGRMFEPFFTTKEVGKGTGLGLSTVFGIVRQSGGAIEVESELGKGSAFKIYLPVTGAVPPGSSSPVPAAPHALRGTETILLVEDEVEVRAVTRAILRKYGYDVLEAETGGDALLLCEQHPKPIHLLLTDVVMPRMNGRQLAEHLLPLRPEMKVLYMSGYTDDAIVRHAVDASSIAFMQKPVTPETLGRKVREVLDAAACR